MTKIEFCKFIIDKQIPLSFIWEDNKSYHFICWLGNEFTTSSEGLPLSKYPKWHKISIKKRYIIGFNGYEEKDGLGIAVIEPVFTSKKENIKECLGDFLFWWEINKGRCKEIKYYND